MSRIGYNCTESNHSSKLHINKTYFTIFRDTIFRIEGITATKDQNTPNAYLKICTCILADFGHRYILKYQPEVSGLPIAQEYKSHV